jgi:hypothetical protein
LAMITALSVGMVIAMSSETLIGGYYRNYRGSFYAADSGANIAVQNLETQLTAGVPTTFATPPITNAATLASGALSALNSSYGSSTSLNAGNAGSSWKESFKITNSTLTLAPGYPQVTSNNTTTGGCSVAAPCPTGYAYRYAYSVTSVGSAQGSEQQTVTETGNINLGITGQAASTAVSFAYFGAFIDYYQGGIGPLVPGTMTGPMFTNTPSHRGRHRTFLRTPSGRCNRRSTTGIRAGDTTCPRQPATDRARILLRRRLSKA